MSVLFVIPLQIFKFVYIKNILINNQQLCVDIYHLNVYELNIALLVHPCLYISETLYYGRGGL